MKKIIISVVIFVIVVVGIGLVSYSIYFSPEESVEVVESLTIIDQECQENNGVWFAEYNECEYVGKTWCDEVSGEFLECESACRHDPNAGFCTMQCVPVCKFWLTQ